MPTTSGRYGIDKAPVVVRWKCADGTERYLGRGQPEPSCQPVVDIGFDEAKNTASIKLRIPVAIKAMVRKINVYYDIPPGRITSLVGVEEEVPSSALNSVIHNTSCRNGDDICCLSFSLNRLGDVIVPAAVPFQPKTKPSTNVLKDLRSFAGAASFQMYFPYRDTFNKHAMEQLCKLCSSNDLTPVAEDLSHLYGGKGGEIPDSLDRLVQGPSEAPPESPPSYDEIAALPPAGNSVSRSSSGKEPPRKKPRLLFGDEKNLNSERGAEKSGAGVAEWRQDVEQRMSALAEELAEMRKQISLPTVPSDAGSFSTRVDSLEISMEALKEQVAGTETRLGDRFRQELQLAEARLKADINEQIEAHSTGIREDLFNDMSLEVELQMENALGLYKEELGDECDERVKDIEETLKAKIRHVFQSIEFD